VLTSADDARERATKAAALLRLVNNSAGAPLIKASDAGDLTARIDFEPVSLLAVSGVRGRLHDQELIDLLDSNKLDVLAQGCRRFRSLGFSVSSVLQDETAGRMDGLYSLSDRVIMSHLVLDYSRAALGGSRDSGPMTIPVSGIALPPAHQWRIRAETALAIKQHERRALARIAEHAEQGADRCLISWKELTRDVPVPEKVIRLAEMLRSRGFDVETTGSTLRVKW